jgi:hypothetical protein
MNTYLSWWQGNVEHLAQARRDLFGQPFGPMPPTLCGKATAVAGHALLSIKPESNQPSDWVKCPTCEALAKKES